MSFIVDDDFAARLQMRFSLKNEGFTVLEAESGAEAFGDKALITIAERLKTIVRHSDVISRPGEEAE